MQTESQIMIKEVFMPLQEEFESQGVWLFRWRSYLPLLLLLLLIYPMLNFRYLGNSEFWDHIWEIFCLAISFLGLGIRVYTIGHTPAHTSGRNTKKQVAEQLNTKGIYSIVRHPLYLGNFFMMLGIVMFCHNAWAIAIFMLLFWVYYERIMYAEEAFLRKKFGDSYIEWGKHTPPFFPRFKNFQRSDLPFSMKNVLKREYNGLLGMLLSMFILEVSGDYVVNRHLEFDTFWIVIIALGFVTWFVLCTLKKTTNILKVQGR